MSKRTPKSVKASCDKLFSKLIRSRGACEKCGMKDYSQFHCAHIYSRKFGSVRFDEMNAFNLCAKDHRFFHDNPIEFGEFIHEMNVDIDELQRRKHVITKRKLADWLILEGQLKRKLNE